MVKIFLKFFLTVIIYTVVFSAANVLLPFSQGFRQANTGGKAIDLLFLMINTLWICFTAYFIIRRSVYSPIKMFFGLLGVLFFIQCVMTQIETLLFINVFPALTIYDVVLIMLAGLFPLLAALPLLIKFFRNKDAGAEKNTLNIKSIALKLGVIGIIYLGIYMVFGYFVAWQFEELRVFYSGSAEKLSFLKQVFSNEPGFFLFQIFRGILLGLFIVPLINMVTKNKGAFIMSVCFVYLCMAVLLVIPNPLFPPMVRYGHLLEMASSMLLFGILTGNILWKESR